MDDGEVLKPTRVAGSSAAPALASVLALWLKPGFVRSFKQEVQAETEIVESQPKTVSALSSHEFLTAIRNANITPTSRATYAKWLDSIELPVEEEP